MKGSIILMRALRVTWVILILNMTVIFSAYAELPLGRIVVSVDGNRHDRDDILATPCTLAILSKSGAASQTRVYVYADHVWSNKDHFEAEMKESTEGSLVLYPGFDNLEVYNGYRETDAAITAIKEQINLSSNTDPLWIIAAGPMHIIGKAIEAADNKKHKYVTIITHSKANNEHSAMDGHDGIDLPDIIASYPEVKVSQISDQNGNAKAPRFKTDASNVGWIKDSTDPKIQWLWERYIAMGKEDFDGSDCGMVWYLIYDDEDGNFDKLRDLLEGPDPTPDVIPDPGKAQYNETDGLVVIEVENTTSDYDLWELKKAIPGYTGEGYLEFTGNKYNKGDAKSPLKYTFTINEAGIYYFNMYCARETIDGHRDWTNDCYIRVEGDYESGGGTPLSILQNNSKCWGGHDMKFVWEIHKKRLDVNHTKYHTIYAFKAGETYTLVVSGRSKAFKLDRIVFRHSKLTSLEQSQDLSLGETQIASSVTLEDFREQYGLRANGSRDLRDWSGNGVVNVMYFLFDLGDPNSSIVDTLNFGANPKSGLPLLTNDGDGTYTFSYVRHKSSQEYQYLVHASKNMLDWDNVESTSATISPESTSTTSLDQSYEIQHLHFGAIDESYFFKVSIQKP